MRRDNRDVKRSGSAKRVVPAYDNTPTVVVVLVPIRGGLLLIRRGVAEGHGELALPGGYQMRGETWQEAGAREIHEETGVQIEAERLRMLSVVTTPDRRQNLLFCQSEPVLQAGPFVHDDEVLEVVVVRQPVRTAFPLHDEQVARFFRSVPSGSDADLDGSG